MNKERRTSTRRRRKIACLKTIQVRAESFSLFISLFAFIISHTAQCKQSPIVMYKDYIYLLKPIWLTITLQSEENPSFYSFYILLYTLVPLTEPLQD